MSNQTKTTIKNIIISVLLLMFYIIASTNDATACIEYSAGC